MGMEGGIWAQSLGTLPAHAGASTGNGVWGPHTGKQAIHHTGWLYVGWGGGRCFLRKWEQGP